MAQQNNLNRISMSLIFIGIIVIINLSLSNGNNQRLYTTKVRITNDEHADTGADVWFQIIGDSGLSTEWFVSDELNTLGATVTISRHLSDVGAPAQLILLMKEGTNDGLDVGQVEVDSSSVSNINQWVKAKSYCAYLIVDFTTNSASYNTENTCSYTPPDNTPAPVAFNDDIDCIDHAQCELGILNGEIIDCTAQDSCKSATIRFGSILDCDSKYSCRYATIDTTPQSSLGITQNAEFSGTYSGSQANIVGVERIEAYGYNALKDAVIDSGELTYMYIKSVGELSLNQADIYCRSGAQCDIICRGRGCYLAKLHCDGQCSVTCDASDCLNTPNYQ